MIVKDLKERLNQLTTDRSTWEDHWQDIRDYVMPYRPSFNTTYSPGEKVMNKIYDPAGVYALYRFAAGLIGLYSSPAVPWFSLTMEEEELRENWEVKIWLGEVERQLKGVLDKSNFYAQIFETYLDFGGYGTACLYVEAHPKTICNFQLIPLGETYIWLDRYNETDTVFRKFMMSARQMEQMWGRDKLSEKVNVALTNNKPGQEFEIVHAVYPRTERRQDQQDDKNMPWASVYFEMAEEHKLNESGYIEMPYLVARSQMMGRETYGRSLGMIALPEIKCLNQIEFDLLRAGAKRIDPPLLMANEAMISPLSFRPGAVSIINAQSLADKMMPMPVGGDLGYGENKTEQKRQRIYEIFFNDLFLQLAAAPPGMTATEVIERSQEKMQLLSPFLGQMQAGLFNPLFDRMFQIMWEGGYLPPPPPALQGQNIKVDNISPLAKAQRWTEGQRLTTGLGYIQPLAQLDPSILARVDFDEVIDELALVLGLPPKVIRTKEQADQIRQAQAQAQQQAMEEAQAMEAAKIAAPQLGKAVEPNSPIDMMATGAEE